MSDTGPSKAQETTRLPERMKHAHLHFQMNDYMRWSNESYHGPSAVKCPRKHLVINVGFAHNHILSDVKQVKGYVMKMNSAR